MATERTLAAGLRTRRQLLAQGLSSRRITELVRLGVIARVARAVYAVDGLPRHLPDPAALCLSWRVVLSFESAAAWWGVDLRAPVNRLHVTAPRQRNRRAYAVRGVRVHRAALRRDDVRTVRGVRVTTPLRTALDVARHAALEDAVAVVDAFMRKRLLTHTEFEAGARAAAGPGRRRIQLVAALVDPEAGSILESLARVLLWRNGMPPEATQHVITHPRSGWRARVDFAWPSRRVVLECDGYEFHSGREAFIGDRRRWSTLERLGWRPGVVTWFDVVSDPAYVVSLVRDLLAGPHQHTNVTPVAAETAA